MAQTRSVDVQFYVFSMFSHNKVYGLDDLYLIEKQAFSVKMRKNDDFNLILIFYSVYSHYEKKLKKK